MLYVFALNQNFKKLLNTLHVPDQNSIITNNIDKYIELLIHDQPSHILGIGSYSGVDKQNIRIERLAKNKFRNHKIEIDRPELIMINNFLKLSDGFKFADALGNSWCNLISWRIMRLIEDGRLTAEYSFLHIPKSIDQRLASKKIAKLVGVILK